MAAQTLLLKEQMELLQSLKAQLDSRTERKPLLGGGGLVPMLAATTPDNGAPAAAPATVATARGWFGGAFGGSSGSESARPAAGRGSATKESPDNLAA